MGGGWWLLVIVICVIVASRLQFERKGRQAFKKNKKRSHSSGLRVRQAAKREQREEEDAGAETDVIVAAIAPNVASATQLQPFPLDAAKLSSRLV